MLQGEQLMRESITTFLREEEGLTMVEYAIAGALVAAAAAATFTDLGASVIARITDLAADVAS
jgi:pilus assembly protein Flp/PilA